MQTIRRLYLYAVALVSLEVVLWGSIGLLRSAFASQQVGGEVTRLASALSLILVGVPVFLTHWLLAQRSALRDREERSARLRALFLYSALMAVLLPIAANIFALLNRSLVLTWGLPTYRTLLGGDQTWSDNLVAILLNAIVAVYLFLILRADWRALDSDGVDAFVETRRLYRYIWMLIGLVLLVSGLQQTLQYLLGLWAAVGAAASLSLANGLSLLLVGAPVWVYAWKRIQNGLTDPAEAASLIRLIVLYALAFLSLGGLLISAGNLLYSLLRLTLGERLAFSAWLAQASLPLSTILSLGVVWAYYGRLLRLEMDALPESPRRSGLKRLYFYALSLAGLAAAFFGVYQLLDFLLTFLLARQVVWAAGLRNELAAALAILAVGLPLWLLTWRPAAREAAQEGESGDHARRSLVRKAYLFLALFAGVIGVMFSTGTLLYALLRAWLGQPPANLLLDTLETLRLVLLFGLLLAYHWQALRSDNRLAARSLSRRHAQFPVLVLTTPQGDFTPPLLEALHREASQLPVAVHDYTLGAPDETLSAARAVILPAECLIRPPEALSLWLRNFEGARLVVPTPTPGWWWMFAGSRSLSLLARHTARAVRSLAEGESLPPVRESSPSMILVYVLAGLFVLEILFVAVAFLISLFTR